DDTVQNELILNGYILQQIISDEAILPWQDNNRLLHSSPTRRSSDLNVSLNNRPPMIFGTATYHAETAVKYQTLTNVCPKLQNNVRLSITLIFSIQPHAQGINDNTSYVTPSVPKKSNTKIPTAKYENKGTCCPRCLFRQFATLINTPKAATHIPKTINTSPI